MQNIRYTDLPEGFALVPYRSRRTGRVQGVTIVIQHRVLLPHLTDILLPYQKNADEAHSFTPFTSDASAIRHGFGFKRGIRLGRTTVTDTTGNTEIHVLFRREYRRGLSFVRNIDWLLRSLQERKYPTWMEKHEPCQLFSIQTGFTASGYHVGFPVTVTVSPNAVRLLAAKSSRTFDTADAIADTLDWFHGSRSHNMMSVRAGRNGTLNIHQEPYSLGINPDHVKPDAGYKMYSDGTDDPVGQIVLLVGLAAVWEELRRSSSDQT